MLNIAQAIKRKILDILQAVKRNINISFLIKVLPILSFAIPFIILYYLDITLYHLTPSSFESTWKGRTYYLFFVWLVFLETILSWEELSINKINKLRSMRTVGFVTFLLLPTIYVLIANFLGLNTAIVNLYNQVMGPGLDWFAKTMPLSIEYLFFGVIFATTRMITYGKRGFTNFSISISLLFAIGAFYIIDNFFPNGKITLLQIPTVPTAHLAANVLNLMGYGTTVFIGTYDNAGCMPYLTIWDPKNVRRNTWYPIGWPCAGVDSFLIYTITILLFLRKSDIPWVQRVIYFIPGAIVTYFINILRIAAIFVLALENGGTPIYLPPEATRFHDYYGPLYSIIWIISYPLIVIGGRILWGTIKNRKLVKRL